jgi:hypothetical protein
VRRRQRHELRILPHFDETLFGAVAVLAEESGVATTAHLLVAAVERSEPLLAWWESASSRALSPREAAGLSGRPGKADDAAPLRPRLGVSFDALASQAIGAASTWARERGEKAGAAHLVVVLLDQRSTPVADVLGEAGLDASMLRERALALIGLHADHPPVALDPLAPAGASNRPPLPLSALPAEAWAACARRQEALLLERLQQRVDWDAITFNEARAVDRLADRFALDDDQRYSLLRHHLNEVRRRAAAVAPSVVDPLRPAGVPTRPVARLVSGPTRHRHHLVPPGWRCWFGNRHVSLRARWLRLAGQRG